MLSAQAALSVLSSNHMLDVNDGQKHDRAAILIDRGIRNMPEQPFERSERSVACSSSHFERTSCFEREYGFFSEARSSELYVTKLWKPQEVP